MVDSSIAVLELLSRGNVYLCSWPASNKHSSTDCSQDFTLGGGQFWDRTKLWLKNFRGPFQSSRQSCRMSEISVLSDANDKSSCRSQFSFIADLNRLEAQFEDRFNSVVKVYESRIKNLTTSVQHFLSDEIVTELRKDPISRSFLPAYLERSVEEHFAEEQETFIQTLLKKISSLETLVAKLMGLNSTVCLNYTTLIQRDKAYASCIDDRLAPALRKIEEVNKCYNEYCVVSDQEITELRAKLRHHTGTSLFIIFRYSVPNTHILTLFCLILHIPPLLSLLPVPNLPFPSHFFVLNHPSPI